MAPLSSIIHLPAVDDTDIDIQAIFSNILHFISTSYNKTAVGHPYVTGFLLMMWSYHPRAPFQAISFVIYDLPKKIFITILRMCGFGRNGIEAGSYASRYQTEHYPNHIPADSLFAQYQSYGAISHSTLDAHGDDDIDEVVPSIWWSMLGWIIYLAGFAVMLFHGSLKGV